MKNKYILLGLMVLLFSCNTNPTLIHNYNYKTIIEERQDKYDYNHFNNKSFTGLCEIEYGFGKNTKLVKAYNTDGTLIVRSGPPFRFSIIINEINSDIVYIKFDSFELVTKSGTYNLLDLNDVGCTTSITYNGKIINPGYDPNANARFWERSDLQTLRELKEEHGINIIGLRSKGATDIEERVKKSAYEYNEEEERLLREERNFRFTLGIGHLPINIADDEEVIVRVNLMFTMTNGSIQRVQFDDVYFREYSESYIRIPPFYFKLFPLE
jgi:hypothetical protein